ncbi:MAG: CocE/NonD family hydrolase, partial [Terracidiphilus sp.]
MPRFCRPVSLAFIPAIALAHSVQLHAQTPPQTPPMTPDIPAKFVPPHNGFEYVDREVMIPMRDGVKLYTVIHIPKGATHVPIILTRTPYDAAMRMKQMESPEPGKELTDGDDVWVEAGFIRVFQDVRGKYGSEGEYVM